MQIHLESAWTERANKERERRERGVCVIVGEILVVKEMVLTVDY